MSADVIIFSLMATSTVTAIGWIREASNRKRLENRLWGLAAAQGLPMSEQTGSVPVAMPMKLRSGDETRMEQLESQIDQLANQVDRLVESQEFLSRVLADRVERPDPRLRTPH